jgi:hypothetical protein
MAGLPYSKIYYFKNFYSIEIKRFLILTKIFLDSQQNVRKLCKKLGFLPKQYFAVLLFKVRGWLFNHAVCKIGLRRRNFALPSMSLILLRCSSFTFSSEAA